MSPEWKMSVTSSKPSASLSLHTWAKHALGRKRAAVLHALGRKRACCRPVLSLVYYNLSVALSSPPESKGGWRKEKERPNDKRCFLHTSGPSAETPAVISLPGIIEFAGCVVLMKKGMLTSRVHLKLEGPRASRFRTSQFRISQISDTWLSTGPRWKLTPWPGRAGIKEITVSEQNHKCCRMWWCVPVMSALGGGIWWRISRIQGLGLERWPSS